MDFELGHREYATILHLLQTSRSALSTDSAKEAIAHTYSSENAVIEPLSDEELTRLAHCVERFARYSFIEHENKRHAVK